MTATCIPFHEACRSRGCRTARFQVPLNEQIRKNGEGDDVAKFFFRFHDVWWMCWIKHLHLGSDWIYRFNLGEFGINTFISGIVNLDPHHRLP